MKKITIFSLLVLAYASAFSQTDKENIISGITKDEIKGHIYFLSDDLLKGRQTGSPGNKIAASYLANTLRGYGVKPNPKTGTYYQKIALLQKNAPKKLTLTIDGKAMKNKVALQASALSFDGTPVFLNYGLDEDYEGKDVSGKVILIKGGNAKGDDARSAFGLRKQKMKLAENAGVKAVVELIKADDNTWGFIDHNFNSSSLEVPDAGNAGVRTKEAMSYVWLHDNADMGSHLANKKHNLSLQIEPTEDAMIHTQNVIGVIEGTDPKLKNEFIIYSAHYDHVGIGTPDATGDTIYNGARDNAVGTTTVLSMAKNLSKYPTKRSALFILFTGEEKGLLGSEYYVENPVLPLEQMVYCFNSDNGGYNDTSVATIIGLPRTTAENNIKKAVAAFGLTAIDDPAPEQGLFDRSDNVNFAAKGIPAPTFSMGFRAFDSEITKYYHQPGDHADSMDYDYLEKFFRAYVMAGRNIANDPVTPFWVKGDKYEAAGNDLYKK